MKIFYAFAIICAVAVDAKAVEYCGSTMQKSGSVTGEITHIHADGKSWKSSPQMQVPRDFEITVKITGKIPGGFLPYVFIVGEEQCFPRALRGIGETLTRSLTLGAKEDFGALFPLVIVGVPPGVSMKNSINKDNDKLPDGLVFLGELVVQRKSQ